MMSLRAVRAVLTLAVAAMPVWAAHGVPARTRGQQGPEGPGQTEVHVDERCRIFSQDRQSDDGRFSRAGFHEDGDICRLQNDMKTKHWEGSIENGVVKRTQVTVIERTFQLHDPTDVPVTFLVEQSVPKGWHVDSTPQPVRIEKNVAVFEVVAQPGQTIRLHVGIRN